MIRSTVRMTVAVLVATLALAPACGKKDDESKSQGTAKPKDGEQTPAKKCDKGQVLEAGTCVVVITPEKIEAIKQTTNKLDDIQKKLDAIEVIAAPIRLLKAMTELEQWKTAVTFKPDLKKVDDFIKTLNTIVTELQGFNTQLKASKAKLTDLTKTLNDLYEGTGAAKTLAEARKQVTTELQAAVQPLQEKVISAVTKAIKPGIAELDKWNGLIKAACMLATAGGGSDDVKKLCDSGTAALQKALDFVKGLENVPMTFFSDLIGSLDKELGKLLEAGVKNAVDDAQKAIDAAMGKGDEK